MLALTMGVSAIVGAIHYLRRSRGRGLRAMVRLLYAREIHPLLARQGAESPPADGLSAEPGIVATRADFIYDMTFMPVPAVVEKLQTKGGDYWREKLVSAEKLVGMPWYLTVFHPLRLGRRWRTLGFSLEVLSDAEFTERLTASATGKTLKAAEAWRSRDLASWNELTAQLLKRFQMLGSAGSENFARHSRVLSVAVGFLLALLLNVDSMDLLNSYLTDPTLRQRVIEQSAAPPPDARSDQKAASTTPAAAPSASQVAGAAREMREALTALDAAASGARTALSPAAQERLREAMSRARDVETGIADFGESLADAERKARNVTASLTSGFPIGWTRFPNCMSEMAPDLRCRGRVFTAVTQGGPWWYHWSATLNRSLPGPPQSAWAMVHGHVTTLAAASVADPATFQQWCVGVIITGLLLGLGTPFWVQAVSAAFNLRRWTRNGDDTATGNSKTTTPGDAGSAMAPTGSPPPAGPQESTARTPPGVQPDTPAPRAKPDTTGSDRA
jgi:hypothetical protein